MIYGLYLSATGVLASSYRQDVVANNLANVETVGFKKDVASFQQRLTEAQSMGLSPRHSDPTLEPMGGGLFALPTRVDLTQGELEHTGNALDVAIRGEGMFAVKDRGQTRLTRDGRLTSDREGYLALATSGQRVLDSKGQEIKLDRSAAVSIGTDGTVTQQGKTVGRVALFDVPEPTKLAKIGRNLLSYPETTRLKASNAQLAPGFVERSNVEPTTELTELLDAQRQLEANANMIKYQDQTLGRLVNDVGKIG